MTFPDSAFLSLVGDIVSTEFPDERELYDVLGQQYLADIKQHTLNIRTKGAAAINAGDPSSINAAVAFVPVMVAAFTLVTELVKKNRGGEKSETIEALYIRELARAHVAESKATKIAAKYAAKLEALAEREEVSP